MISRQTTAGLCAALALWLPGNPRVHGQSGPASRIVTVVPGPTLDAAILVGPSGQLYHPAGSLRWQRRTAGGVATDVAGATATPKGIFVGGSRAPVYRFEGGAWHAHPLTNRGRIAMSRGGHPVLAVGRHVYVWQKGRFQRITSADKPIIAIWASSPQRIYAATRTGQLRRYSRNRWNIIRHTIPAADQVWFLVGQPGKKLYAATRAGRVLEVGPTRARILASEPALEQLLLHTATVGKNGTLWLVGSRPATATDTAAGQASSTQLVLARLRKRRLELVEPIPALPRDARVTALLSAGDDALLVVTEGGLLQYRTAPRQWKSGTISFEVPAKTPVGSRVGPARTR